MGMTIEQDIKVIRKMLAYTDLSVRANLTADMVDACEDAIDTMRKYQKIEQILKDEFEQYHPLDRDPYKLYLIGKVMEDGNDI